MKAPVKAALAAALLVGTAVLVGTAILVGTAALVIALAASRREETPEPMVAPRVSEAEETTSGERATPPARGSRSAPSPGDRPVRKKPKAAVPEAEPGPTALPNPKHGSVVVTVVDAAATPLEGIPVILAGEHGLVSSVTEADGGASFPKLEEGSWELRLRPPESTELESSEKLHVESGDEKQVTVRIGAYELSISGRVLDRRGNPVAGIPVEAARIAGPDDEGLLRVRARREPAITLEDGSYEITELEPGEHGVRTQPVKTYASSSRVARAGSEAVDLVVDEGRSIAVRGRVSDPAGRSLHGVEVLSVSMPSRRVTTDADGSYGLEVLLGSREKLHYLRFRLDGYRQVDLEIRDDGAENGEVALDASLEPLGPAGRVSGVVVSDDGAPLEGQALYLESPLLRIRSKATSDAAGRFSFEEAPAGDDYRLSVRPGKDFEDFSMNPLELAPGGLEVEVLLERLEQASLASQVVNVAGEPIPDVSFWVSSASARGRSLEVKTDADGRFELPECPAGKILLDTRSAPRFTVRGLELPAGSGRDVRIVVDSGQHEVTGTVTDPSGLPLEGAPVEITWSHVENGVRASSQRKTLTDDEGRFHFEGLGSGRHTIKASAENYRTAQLDHEVGSAATVPVIRLAAGP